MIEPQITIEVALPNADGSARISIRKQITHIPGTVPMIAHQILHRILDEMLDEVWLAALEKHDDKSFTYTASNGKLFALHHVFNLWSCGILPMRVNLHNLIADIERSQGPEWRKT